MSRRGSARNAHFPRALLVRTANQVHCDSPMTRTETTDVASLTELCIQAFENAGLPAEHAEITTSILSGGRFDGDQHPRCGPHPRLYPALAQRRASTRRHLFRSLRTLHQWR